MPDALPATPQQETPIFPDGPLPLGRIATAELVSVLRTSGDIVARYELTPSKDHDLADLMGQLKGKIGRRYPVLPGMWATFVVPEDEDEVELHLGLAVAYGKALLGAQRSLRVPKGPVVSELAVKMAALGYLRGAGVRTWSRP